MIDIKKIKTIMKEREILNKELADAVGVSESMMTYVLKGMRCPNVATLVRMAQTLGCTVDELLVDVENNVERM